MKKMVKLMLASLMMLGVMSGCGNTVSNSDSKNDSVTLDANAFDASTGVVTEEVTLESTKTGTTVTIEEGTMFQDEQGEVISIPTTLNIDVEESSAQSETTIGFEANGEKAIPTRAVKVTVPAPAGARPGDRVQVEVPDGVTAKMQQEQKLIFVIVKADGTVDVTIYPDAFRGLVVLVFVIEDASTN